MTWSTYEKIILEAEKYDCPSLNPQGINEPLLDQDLENYIKFASNHGFIDIMMNTNATLLSEERCTRLLESGLTRLRFSLDAATKETYEKIRVGAKFESVIEKIEQFLEIKERGGYELPVVGVNLVKMKMNEHEIDQFVDMWKDKVDFKQLLKSDKEIMSYLTKNEIDALFDLSKIMKNINKVFERLGL